MFKGLTKLNSLQKTVIVSCVIALVLIGLSLIGLAFGQVGWVIGVSVGSIACILNVVITELGATKILKESKPSLLIAIYLVKLIILVGLFAALVVLERVAKVPAFKNSFWGFLIGFAPTTFISVFSQMKPVE